MDINYHLEKNFFKNPLKYGSFKLFQIGRMYCNNTEACGTHVHLNLFELTVVTGGEGKIFTNDIASDVKRGDIYLSMPFENHGLFSDAKNPLKFDFIAFTCDDAKFKNELERLTENYHSPYTRVLRDERINRLVASAISETVKQRPFHKENMTAILQQLVIYLLRAFRKITPEKDGGIITKPEILCYQLMHYIDTHIYTMKNLGELSAVTSYSYGYISALFKKTTSQTLSHYYNSKKADISRLLIAENRMSISEIAEQLNFSSVYAFSKAFKAHFGMSPREYRKKFIDIGF